MKKGTRTSRYMSPTSALYTDDLAQGVHHVDEVGLGGHDGVDVLVGHRRLVDHLGVLAALDALGGADVVLHREAPLGLGPAHRPAGAVRAGVERVRVALAAHDEGLGPHR